MGKRRFCLICKEEERRGWNFAKTTSNAKSNWSPKNLTQINRGTKPRAFHLPNEHTGAQAIPSRAPSSSSPDLWALRHSKDSQNMERSNMNHLESRFQDVSTASCFQNQMLVDRAFMRGEDSKDSCPAMLRCASPNPAKLFAALPAPPPNVDPKTTSWQSKTNNTDFWIA